MAGEVIRQLAFAGNATGICRVCHRVLTNPASVQAGIGPVCAGRQAEPEGKEPRMQQYDLEWNSDTRDIVFERGGIDPDTGEATDFDCRFNIPQALRHHSPTGMEWGYAGSGPADFALNILAVFLPGEDVKLWDGNHCSQEAYDLHQPFKFQWIATAPREGGVITGKSIEAWIADQLAKRAEHADQG